MLFNAKNGELSFDNTVTEYIRFGNGDKTLVFLPGLGDGLRSLKGTALLMAFLYRKFSRNHTVYMFSRKREIPCGTSTKDMADDLRKAMDMLEIDKADIIGVSMGGMIAQHLAADFPDKVDKLVLAVTSAGCNSMIENSINEWLRLAEQGKYSALMESNLRLIYSEKYYKANRWLLPLTAALTKPKSFERFFRQAEACMSHDALSRLSYIKAPTLIIGGAEDRVLGCDASKELHNNISGSILRIYPEGNHGLYDEEKDFNSFILAFFNEGQLTDTGAEYA